MGKVRPQKKCSAMITQESLAWTWYLNIDDVTVEASSEFLKDHHAEGDLQRFVEQLNRANLSHSYSYPVDEYDEEMYYLHNNEDWGWYCVITLNGPRQRECCSMFSDRKKLEEVFNIIRDNDIVLSEIAHDDDDDEVEVDG